MLGFAIFSSNHVVFIPAFVLVIALAWERWVKNRVLMSVLLLVIVFLFSFGLYYYQGLFTELRLYSDLMKILPLVLTTIGLYWMRWWAVRPPRIWADQFGVRK
jgi:uncharacterized membrane protein